MCQNYQCKLVHWNVFDVITEQCNIFYPHLGMHKTINIAVNIFYSLSTICTTGGSSSRHPAQTAVSGIASGVFSRASPGLYLCWEHGEQWPAQPSIVEGAPFCSHWFMALLWTTQTLLSFPSLAAFEWCGGSCLGLGNLGPSFVVCNAFPAKQSREARYSIKKLLRWNLFPCWSD